MIRAGLKSVTYQYTENEFRALFTTNDDSHCEEQSFDVIIDATGVQVGLVSVGQNIVTTHNPVLKQLMRDSM